MLERVTYLNARRRKHYRVFVYGTLVSSGPNHEQYLHQRGHEAEYIGAYEVPGELWVWGALPFMLSNKLATGKVYGEMWGVDEHALNRLDRLEGISMFSTVPTYDWYTHAIVDGIEIINGSRMSAIAYIFNLVPPRLRHSCMRIVGGDYLDWLRTATGEVPNAE